MLNIIIILCLTYPVLIAYIIKLSYENNLYMQKIDLLNNRVSEIIDKAHKDNDTITHMHNNLSEVASNANTFYFILFGVVVVVGVLTLIYSGSSGQDPVRECLPKFFTHVEDRFDSTTKVIIEQVNQLQVENNIVVFDKLVDIQNAIMSLQTEASELAGRAIHNTPMDQANYINDLAVISVLPELSAAMHTLPTVI